MYKTPRFIGSLGDAKYSKSKRCTKKTAITLLDRDDSNPRLSTAQRKTLEERAGKQYSNRNPMIRRSDESDTGYISRINKLMS